MNIFEKAIEFGFENLENFELLMILTGVSERIAKKQVENGWLSIEECNFINEKQKVKYNSLNEAVRRISIEKLPNRYKICSTDNAGDYAIKLLLNKKIEEFHIISLDVRNNVIRTKCLHKGTINECVVYPREVIKETLEANAANVILCHNHPGGSLSPSSADIQLTNKLIAALKTINISCFDHIITAGNDFFSFAENGLISK
jgi:DNA repair protein RadC